METETRTASNVKQAVPFFGVENMKESLRFVSICFVCEDALAIYREIKSRGIDASRPFVGNGMWVTSVTDPNGYRIDFESCTDVPEETVLSE